MHRLFGVLLIVVVGASVRDVSAQQYPTKPIRFIIPFPPGDSLDIMSRLIAPHALERLGRPIVVDNRPGAAGQLGLTLGARAPADGYTVI